MSLVRYKGNELLNRLRLQDREEQLATQRGQINAANAQQTAALISTLAKSAGMLPEAFKALDEQQQRQIVESLGAGDAVESAGGVPSVSPTNEGNSVIDKTKDLNLNPPPMDLKLPSPSKGFVYKQDLPGGGRLQNGQLTLSDGYSEPQKPLALKLDESLTSGAATTIDADKAGTAVFTDGTKEEKAKDDRWEAPQYKRDARAEAEFQVSKMMGTGANNVFTNLLRGDPSGATFERRRDMALNQATKAIEAERSKKEKESFDRWEKTRRVDIYASKGGKTEEQLQAELDYKRAQTDAARALANQRETQLTLKTEIKPKDAASLENASNAGRLLHKTAAMAVELVNDPNEGLPVSEAKEMLSGLLQAAGSDIDGSNFGTGAFGASVNSSRGGAYVDDQKVQEALDKIDRANMSPAQRRYLRNSLLLAQQLGKAKEGGKLTDKDLAFYLSNIVGKQTPQDVFQSFEDISEDLNYGYAQSYNRLAPAHKDQIEAYEKPAGENMAIMRFKPEQLGAKDWNEVNARNEAKERARINNVKKDFKGAESAAGEVGFGRKGLGAATDIVNNAIKGAMENGGTELVIAAARAAGASAEVIAGLLAAGFPDKAAPSTPTTAPIAGLTPGTWYDIGGGKMAQAKSDGTLNKGSRAIDATKNPQKLPGAK